MPKLLPNLLLILLSRLAKWLIMVKTVTISLLLQIHLTPQALPY